MHKETLIAVIIGLILGLSVTYTVYRLKVSVTKPDNTDVTVLATPSPSAPEEVAALSITTPVDGVIQEDTTLAVKGVAKNAMAVLVFLGGNIQVVTPELDGSFQTDLKLSSGPNIISFISVDKEGQSAEILRSVFVSDLYAIAPASATNVTASAAAAPQATSSTKLNTAKPTVRPSTKPSPTAIPSADQEATKSSTPSAEIKQETTQAILDRINKKLSQEQQSELTKTLEQLMQKRRGYVGPTERITQDSITLRTLDGSPLLMPLDAKTVIVKNGKKITSSEIAVENWLMALGVEDDNTFKPEYIEVFTKSLQPKQLTARLGTIKSLTKKNLVLINRADSAEETLTFVKETKYQDATGKTIASTKLSSDLAVLIAASQDDTGKQALLIRLLSAITPTDAP